MNRTFFLLTIIMWLACQSGPTQQEIMQWKIAAELPAPDGDQVSPGLAGPVTGVLGDRLIIGGGANFPEAMPWNGGTKVYHQAIVSYKKTDTGFILLPEINALPFPLAYSANCSFGDRIVVAGGENSQGLSNSVFIIHSDPKTDTLAVEPLPSLPEAITNASATCAANILYVLGGETKTTVSDRFYQLNLNDRSAGWKELPSLPVAVSHAVLVFHQNENHLLLMGGRKKNSNGISDFYNSVYSFDIKNNRWTEEGRLPYPVAAGTGLIFKEDIFLIGGDGGETFNRTERLLASISQEEDLLRKDFLVGEKNRIQEAHPGFIQKILIRKANKKNWEIAGVFPFPMPVTTTALVMGDRIILPSGEIRAGVRTPYIFSGTFNKSGKSP